MNFGIFLQLLGVGVAIIGFIIAGKTGHSDLQIPALVIGIATSVIGFLKHLETPINEQRITRSEEDYPRYTTKAEKDKKFLKGVIYYALFIIVPSYFNREPFLAFPKLLFIPLTMYALLLIWEAYIIYR